MSRPSLNSKCQHSFSTEYQSQTKIFEYLEISRPVFLLSVIKHETYLFVVSLRMVSVISTTLRQNVETISKQKTGKEEKEVVVA